jgi:hypothetical protein
MATNIQIYVEGEFDKRFLHQYISTLNIPNSDIVKIDPLNGWTNLKNVATINKLSERTFQGMSTILILDADNDFQNRCAEVEEIKNTNNLMLDYFLLPNHRDVGAIETVLTNIVDKKHKVIIDCFEIYRNCIQTKNSKYFLPTTKQQIYALAYTIYGDTKPKAVNFLETENWDLKHNILDNLKQFLLTHCKLSINSSQTP